MRKNSVVKCNVSECIHHMHSNDCRLNSITVTSSNLAETCCGNFEELD